ncbi:MAG: hypothetical protein ABWY27_04115 [Telluria sp.]
MRNPAPDLPFNPDRAGLYSAGELFAGLADNDPTSYARTPDFRSYMYFEENGRNTVGDRDVSINQALHDAAITRAMHAFLKEHERAPVAIMGGHAERRGSDTYVAVVKMAKGLAEKNFLVASGGGPGCMEATHLGAMLAGRSEGDVADAIERMKTQAALPPLTKQMFGRASPTAPWSINYERVQELHRWMQPALSLAKELAVGAGVANCSLAIPTWHYGHEPLTPFASHVAKYFLNSIREDVLLAIASNGVVFTKGRAGTLQEIFQDAAQNYYRNKDAHEPLTPMIFFDSAFWSTPATLLCDGDVANYKLPVKELLHSLLVCTGNTKQEEFDKYVTFCDDVDEVVQRLQDLLPPKPPGDGAIMQSLANDPKDLPALVRSLAAR